MFKEFVTKMNERLISGGQVYFPVPPGGLVSLLEAGLLKTRGEVKSLLPYAQSRVVRVGGRLYRVYSL